MFFASDNWAGAHSTINERLMNETTRFAAAYGNSDLDRAIEARFNDIFEKEVAVFFVATGTAANSLALSNFAKPGGVVFAHADAHVIEDECGAPDFFSRMRIAPVEGPEGKMNPIDLQKRIARFPQDAVHHGRANSITITQATEVGTVYSLDEIQAISAIAKENGLPLHMDGARFANALAKLGTTAAEMTWKSGVDVLSFGGTKNGCWCAEAIVFFDPEKAKEMPFLRKRSAQLFSKSRFIAAQFDAYLTNDLWLQLARHANDIADLLREGLARTNNVRLAWQTESNEVFAVIPIDLMKAAQANGAKFYDWPEPAAMAQPVQQGEMLIRLVTSFATERQDVEDFLKVLQAG